MKNFEIIVSEDIKNKASDSDKDFLRLPENWELWRESLLYIIETVTEKISELEKEIHELRKAYPDFTVDPAALSASQLEKSMRFRFHAEKRLAEVDRLIHLGKDENRDDSLLTFLRDAIAAHKKWNEDNGVVNSEGDDCLYAALDGEWKF